MTLLTISPEIWSWAHLIGPVLNIIPAAISIWWCSRIDVKKWSVIPIGLTVYVVGGLMLYYGIMAIRAAGIIVVS